MKKIIIISSILIHLFSFSQLAGSLDASFGANGFSNHDFGNLYFFPEMAVEQPDGKFLVSGQNNLESGKIVVIRFLENGIIDNSYGTNGRATFGNTPFNAANAIHKMVLQLDGKLLLLGDCTVGPLILIRFNQNGSIDSSFGQNGYYVSDNPILNRTIDFEIQNDNKILVSHNGFNPSLPFISRLNSNGTIDTTFGNNGKIFTLSNSEQGAFKIINQQDQKFIVLVFQGNTVFLKRYNQDGTLDNSYLNANGYNFWLAYADFRFSLITQPDGKCLIKRPDNNNSIKISRINIDGSFDTSFGFNGTVYFNTPNNTFSSNDKFVVQSDGKILVPGLFNDLVNFNGNNAMLRFNTNGSIDTTFGNNGLVLIRNNDQSTNYGNLIALQSGKILHMAIYEYGASNPANSGGRFTGFERFNSGVQLSNEKFEINKIVNISPNPGSGIFNVNLINNLNNFKEIEVYDLLGKLILNQNIENKTHVNIDLSKYESGYYLAKLYNDNYSTVVKLLKN
jgi:uncharacterized delta-60 repeat protein